MAKQTENDHAPDYVHDQEDLPGYPPYPKEDDIMRKGQRVGGDFGEESVAGPSAKQVGKPEDAKLEDGEVSPNNYDVTEEDLQGLGPVDLSLDLGDDEQLKQRTQPVDFAASDLDVPGSELDDDAEAMGAEDEENNSYSLGGDAHSDLEEGRQ